MPKLSDLLHGPNGIAGRPAFTGIGGAGRLDAGTAYSASQASSNAARLSSLASKLLTHTQVSNSLSGADGGSQSRTSVAADYPSLVARLAGLRAVTDRILDSLYSKTELRTLLLTHSAATGLRQDSPKPAYVAAVLRLLRVGVLTVPSAGVNAQPHQHRAVQPVVQLVQAAAKPAHAATTSNARAGSLTAPRGHMGPHAHPPRAVDPWRGVSAAAASASRVVPLPLQLPSHSHSDHMSFEPQDAVPLHDLDGYDADEEQLDALLLSDTELHCSFSGSGAGATAEDAGGSAQGSWPRVTAPAALPASALDTSWAPYEPALDDTAASTVILSESSMTTAPMPARSDEVAAAASVAAPPSLDANAGARPLPKSRALSDFVQVPAMDEGDWFIDSDEVSVRLTDSEGEGEGEGIIHEPHADSNTQSQSQVSQYNSLQNSSGSAVAAAESQPLPHQRTQQTVQHVQQRHLSAQPRQPLVLVAPPVRSKQGGRRSRSSTRANTGSGSGSAGRKRSRSTSGSQTSKGEEEEGDGEREKEGVEAAVQSVGVERPTAKRRCSVGITTVVAAASRVCDAEAQTSPSLLLQWALQQQQHPQKLILTSTSSTIAEEDIPSTDDSQTGYDEGGYAGAAASSPVLGI